MKGLLCQFFFLFLHFNYLFFPTARKVLAAGEKIRNKNIFDKMKKIVFSVVILLALAVVSCKEKPGGNGGDDQTDTGTIVASDYVDLGLISKTLWDTCNIGASSPEKKGNFYAWGETAVKDDYKWNTYIDPYDTILPDDIASTQYDVAHVKLGDGWHMPTKEQMEELIASCTWQGGRVNGVTGYNVIGPNGNFIFLPFTGFSKAVASNMKIMVIIGLLKNTTKTMPIC